MNSRKSNQIIPVIILDVHQRSQEGIIQALGRRDIPIVAISHKQHCPAFRSKYVSQYFVSPETSAGEESYIDFLVNLPVKGVLIYSTDLNTLIVSKYQDRLTDAGFLLNIPCYSILDNVFDKWKCFKIAKSLGIPVAKTQLVESIEDIKAVWDSFKKPVILKPTKLAGGMYRKFDTMDEAEKNIEWIQKIVESPEYQAMQSEIILQEWLEYDMTDIWCCEAVYSTASMPIGLYTIKKIHSSLSIEGNCTSRLFAGEHIHSKDLIAMVETLLSKMDWKGFAHVDCLFVPSDNKFYLTEVNPRLPGFSFYPTSAGFDMAYYYYADLVGGALEVPEEFPISVYLETFRYPGDLTECVRYIARGHMRLGHFLKPYLKLLRPNTQKIIEPIRTDDWSYTIYSLLDNCNIFYKDVINFLKRRLPM